MIFFLIRYYSNEVNIIWTILHLIFCDLAYVYEFNKFVIKEFHVSVSLVLVSIIWLDQIKLHTNQYEWPRVYLIWIHYMKFISRFSVFVVMGVLNMKIFFLIQQTECHLKVSILDIHLRKVSLLIAHLICFHSQSHVRECLLRLSHLIECPRGSSQVIECPHSQSHSEVSFLIAHLMLTDKCPFSPS